MCIYIYIYTHTYIYIYRERERDVRIFLQERGQDGGAAGHRGRHLLQHGRGLGLYYCIIVLFHVKLRLRLHGLVLIVTCSFSFVTAAWTRPGRDAHLMRVVYVVYYCIVALLYCCILVLLYYCTIVLLYCIIVLCMSCASYFLYY